MKITKILYTPQFQKSWKKIPLKIQKKAEKKERLFRQNAFHPFLKTHKLTGQLDNYWSFSIDHSTRVVFRFLKENQVLFVDVGSHEIYR